MKATFIGQIQGYSGKYKQIVYCHSRMFGNTYVRENVYPTITEHHIEQGSKTAAIFAVQPTEGYKDDMKDYLFRYNSLANKDQKPIRTWANLYMKLMFEMAARDPRVDLRTITRQFIYDNDLPCISLKRAIEAGYLPKLSSWSTYTQEI